MPCGRGHGRRRRVMSFLQPCLLVLLHRDHAHGYSLMNELANFGFDPACLDPSLVYRALREMEAAGLVVSEWSPESLGPQRRVYRVTPDGRGLSGAVGGRFAPHAPADRRPVGGLCGDRASGIRPEY